MNHTRLSVLTVGLILAATAAQAAGNVRAGLKAGVNLAKVTGSDAGDAQNLTGLVGGGFVGIKLSSLVVQPELLFSMKGTKVNTEKIELSYIELPVLLKMAPRTRWEPLRPTSRAP